jgi:hypothetical protein
MLSIQMCEGPLMSALVIFLRHSSSSRAAGVGAAAPGTNAALVTSASRLLPLPASGRRSDGRASGR